MHPTITFNPEHEMRGTLRWVTEQLIDYGVEITFAEAEANPISARKTEMVNVFTVDPGWHDADGGLVVITIDENGRPQEANKFFLPWEIIDNIMVL